MDTPRTSWLCTARTAARSNTVWTVAVILFAGLAPAQEQTGEGRVAKARSVFQEWAETSRKIASERARWELGKEMLADRIALLKQQIAALQTKVESADAALVEVEKNSAELTAERDALRQASATLAAKVLPLEARTAALIPGLPAPLAEQVKVFSQRLPQTTAKADEDGNAKAPTTQSVSARYQNVVGILLGVNKFHRGIHLTNEVRELSDGTTAEVATLYIGLGQAFYINAKGDRAGVGVADGAGWSWTAMDAAAPRIARAFAIYENTQGAAFVPLPVRIL